MQKGIFANASPLTRLTLTATVVALCFSFFYFAGLLVARFAFHIDFKDLNGDLAAQFVANHAGAFQFLQIMQTTGMFIIPPFIVGYLIQRDAPSYLLCEAERPFRPISLRRSLSLPASPSSTIWFRSMRPCTCLSR